MDQTRRPLRVLFVEDAPNDAELETMALRRGGYEPSYRRVETREDMEQALGAESWDIVIADYNMPQFDGMSALSLFQEKALEIPFITVGLQRAAGGLRYTGWRQGVPEQAGDRGAAAADRAGVLPPKRRASDVARDLTASRTGSRVPAIRQPPAGAEWRKARII